VQAFRDKNIENYNISLEIIPMKKNERYLYYKEFKEKIKDFTAIFCASDAYAIEVMNYLMDNGVKIPEDISIAGFDDIPASTIVRPALTTIKQDIGVRAETAMRLLNELINGYIKENNIILPVELVERGSVKPLKDKV
ncbi:MAG TPA: LacI family transcriptional regulator, partial [Clostridium sp.]|nr:LacI family transcriptional regulator [Clostridium sp.]